MINKIWGILSLSLVFCSSSYAAPLDDYSLDSYALLGLANEARADVNKQPYLWSDDLGRAALAHSTDMATNLCFQHDSCNGQSWSKRVTGYYPGWTFLGENIIAGGTNPREMHDGWMDSPGHRANILGNFLEMGAGVAPAINPDGSRWLYGTEDFGWRYLQTIPTLPAGGVVPRYGFGTDIRELFVNFFDTDPPSNIQAIVGNSCVDLPLIHGTAINGTYGTTKTFPADGCVPVTFEVTRHDGTRRRWPSDFAIMVGTNYVSLNCDTRLPQQGDICGTGPLPTPSPTPAPTPVPSTVISLLKVNHTRTMTIVTGVISIPADVSLIDEVTLKLDGVTVASIPGNCMNIVGRGMRSWCHQARVSLSPTRIPSFRFRFVIPSLVTGTKAELSLGSLIWKN